MAICDDSTNSTEQFHVQHEEHMMFTIIKHTGTHTHTLPLACSRHSVQDMMILYVGYTILHIQVQDYNNI